MREHLPTLQLRQKWQQVKKNFQEGDIVLVVDENATHGRRPLGRVSRTFRGKDGLVRSVEIKASESVLRRPISKLWLLEGQI